ncbi:MAG TPA: hypothetical protein VKY15_02410 [Acidimicrobiales bacterium]|nr:hypothetical protein [Acidimicrobiales bacterium]
MSQARRRRPRQAAQLAEERDYLLGALADLEAERAAGELGEKDYQRLRQAYMARAAQTLRQLERRGAGGDQPEPEPAPRRRTARRPRRGRRWLLWGGVGLVLAGAALALAAALVGGPAPSPGPRQLSEEVDQGIALVDQGRFPEAQRIFDQVLRDDPHQARALAYEGWILWKSGVARKDATLVAAGRSWLQAAVAADPRLPEAHAFLGYVLFLSYRDPKGAVAQFRQFLADHPSAQMRSATAQVLDQAFAAAGQAPPPAGPGR